MKIYITKSRYDASIIELEVTKETAKMYIVDEELAKDIAGNRAHLWFNSRVHKNDPNVFTSLIDAKNHLAKRLANKIIYLQQQINEAQQVIEDLEDLAEIE